MFGLNKKRLLVIYSGSPPNNHSRKPTAILMASFTKPRFSLLPYNLCIFTFR